MFINSFVKTLLYHKTYPSNVYNALVFNIFRVVPPQSKFRNILNTLKSNPYTPRHFPVSLNPESTSSLPVCVDFLNLDAPAMWSFATDFLGLAQCLQGLLCCMCIRFILGPNYTQSYVNMQFVYAFIEELDKWDQSAVFTQRSHDHLLLKYRAKYE